MAAMDNFERNAGFASRFGTIYVDYATRQRTPKMSAHYHHAVIKPNAVLP